MVLLIWLVLFHLVTDVSQIDHFRTINLIPYAQSASLNDQVDLSEIIYNVLVFIPVGTYLMLLGNPDRIARTIGIGLGISLAFEVIQYVFALGASDITDVINNTLGVVFGLLLAIGLKKALKERAETVINIVVLVGSLGLVGAYLAPVLIN